MELVDLVLILGEIQCDIPSEILVSERSSAQCNLDTLVLDVTGIDQLGLLSGGIGNRERDNLVGRILPVPCEVNSESAVEEPDVEARLGRLDVFRLEVGERNGVAYACPFDFGCNVIYFVGIREPVWIGVIADFCIGYPEFRKCKPMRYVYLEVTEHVCNNPAESYRRIEERAAGCRQCRRPVISAGDIEENPVSVVE